MISENLRAAMEFAFDASGRRFEQTCMRAAAAANNPDTCSLHACTAGAHVNICSLQAISVTHIYIYFFYIYIYMYGERYIYVYV